jgi:hypothetical protein
VLGALTRTLLADAKPWCADLVCIAFDMGLRRASYLTLTLTLTLTLALALTLTLALALTLTLALTLPVRHGAAPRELATRHTAGRGGSCLLRQGLGQAVPEESELGVGRRQVRLDVRDR